MSPLHRALLMRLGGVGYGWGGGIECNRYIALQQAQMECNMMEWHYSIPCTLQNKHTSSPPVKLDLRQGDPTIKQTEIKSEG